MFLSKKLLTSALLAAFATTSISAYAAALSRKPQDNIFYATGVDPLGLDPALVDDFDSGNVLFNLYEGLVAFKDENTDIKPSLAESWTVSDDGLTYTFKLRKGVKFHDGTPFNAEAVKFNYDRQMPEVATPKMSYASMVLVDVKETNVIDEYTVEIKLKKKSTPFLHNLAMSFSAPIASPTALKASNNNINEAPVGTGPYKFVAWDKGQQVILTRFEDYWGEKAKTQNLIIKTIPETSARVVALKNGEVDIITGIDSNVIQEIKASGKVIVDQDGMNTNFISYNCNPKSGAVTLDKEVRKAISMSINVPEMVDSLYKGYASVANSFLPTFMEGYSKDVKYPQYNPVEAKKIFEKKGIKKLTMITYSGARAYNTAGGQVLAEAVQAYLAKVGIDVDLQVYDWATYRNKMLNDKYDISFIGWSGDNGDADNFLNLFATDDPIANNPYWLYKPYQDLIAKGMETPDGKERAAIYVEAEKVMAEESPILPISHARQLVAISPALKDTVIHPVGLYKFQPSVKK